MIFFPERHAVRWHNHPRGVKHPGRDLCLYYKRLKLWHVPTSFSPSVSNHAQSSACCPAAAATTEDDNTRGGLNPPSVPDTGSRLVRLAGFFCFFVLPKCTLLEFQLLEVHGLFRIWVRMKTNLWYYPMTRATDMI